MATKRCKSDVFVCVHEAASDLAKAGYIDKLTMGAFDAGCLTQVEPPAKPKVRAIRKPVS
jgi:DNA-binding transcriptional regulator YiaG